MTKFHSLNNNIFDPSAARRVYFDKSSSGVTKLSKRRLIIDPVQYSAGVNNAQRVPNRNKIESENTSIFRMDPFQFVYVHPLRIEE